MDLSQLHRFQRVDLSETAPSKEIALADHLLRLFTRLGPTKEADSQPAPGVGDVVDDKLSGYRNQIEKLVDSVESHNEQLKEDKRELNQQIEGLTEFIANVLTLLHDFRTAVKSIGNDETLRELETLNESLSRKMEVVGLRRIPDIGAKPDSRYHSVEGTRTREGDQDVGEIVEVITPGYKLHGETIRKALVITAE